MPQTTFKITIKNMRATDIPALDACGTSDPFVKVNFDNFKTYTTAVKYKDLHPKWDEVTTFVYTTKYADCLSRKSVTFEVFDHNRFSSNELIGSTKLDLHTIATGCVSHTIPLRDGRKTRGDLHVDIQMEQLSSVECRLVSLMLKGSTTGMPHGPVLELECKVPSCPATAKVGVQSTSSGPMTLDSLMSQGGWTHPDILYAEGSLKEVTDTCLEFNLKAERLIIAQVKLTLAQAYTFVEGEAVEFSEVLSPVESYPLPSGLRLTGSLIYSGFPLFAQMAGGRHTEAGIKGAYFPFQSIPFRPRCALTDERGSELAAFRHGIIAERALAEERKAGPGPRTTAPATNTAGPPEDLSVPKHKPGNPSGVPPPAVSDRLFGGATGLPLCWVRREDPSAPGRVAFENLCNGVMEVELPRDSEYVVTLPATSSAGPLGMQLEPNFSGTQRSGIKSGRRNSGYDIGAVVRGLKPDSPLQAAGRLRPGHHLIAINGSSVLKSTFEATVSALRGAGRPLILRFHDPYAAPPALAVQAMKANLSAKQSQAQSHLRQPYAGGKPVGAKPGASAAPKPFSRSTQAEAQRTLDMALDMLSKVNVAEGLAGPDGEQVGKAVQDAGFLRTLTAVITGTAGDAAPAAVRERLESESRERSLAAQRAAQQALEEEMGKGPGWNGKVEEKKGEEEEEEERAEETSPLEATAAAITADSSAARALRVLTNLTGGGRAEEADLAAKETMAATAARMAELGVFSRAIAAVSARPSSDVAAAAVQALSANAGMLHSSTGAVLSMVEGVHAMGLGGTSLILLQQAAHRHEYAPEMVARSTDLVTALCADSPEQDGLGFLALAAKTVAACADMAVQGYAREKAADGSTFYVTPSGESEWDPPATVKAVFDLLRLLDRRARLIEDAAIPSASSTTLLMAGPDGKTMNRVPLMMALPTALELCAHDSYVCAALLGTAAKLAALPANASDLLRSNMLRAADMALGNNPADARVAEVFTTLVFNIGRDLDSSEALLQSGGVAKISALARAYLKHRNTWTGSVASWAPEGHEAECGEVIVLPGVDRSAREKNALRPRLVRTAINVLINLACFRRTVVVKGESGESMPCTSVDMIVACGGVPLLGEVLLAHINDSAVVTSVLNCAANIAFKNREVQLSIGESMTDAIVLSGWSFQRDANLLSMALRAIGNLTNEDLNIYRGLGFGVVRMMAAAMRGNATNVALQTLGASVLSNIASVEPLEDESEAAEDVSMFIDTVSMRASHPAMALRPSPEDEAGVRALVGRGMKMWEVAPWLLVEGGAVSCLTFAMTKYAQDVNLVEACLRTLHCTCTDDAVTAELVNKYDLTGRVLFVMRACDFDVHVQSSGCGILSVAASNPACASIVVGSDAAHTLLMALDTNKGSMATALQAAAHAVGSAGGGDPHFNPARLLVAMEPYLEGKPAALLSLLPRLCDCVSALAGPRATAAALELASPATLAMLLHASSSLLHALAMRGFSFTSPPATSRMLTDLLNFTEAGATLLAEWVRHPSARLGGPSGMDGRPFVSAEEEAACFSARAMLSQGGRAWPSLVRLLELALAAPPGTAPCDTRVPVALAATPKVVRALLLLPAAIMLRAPVIPDRSASTRVSHAAAGLSPGQWPTYPGAGNVLDVEAQGVEALAGAGAGPALAALAVALAHYVSAAMAGAASTYAAMGSLMFDVSAVSGRAAASTALALLDALGSVSSPPSPILVTVQDEMTGALMQVAAPPPASADALAAAVGGTAVAASILAASMNAHAGAVGFLGKDVIPSPLRLPELVDVANRAASHTSARVQGGGAAVAPIVSASEARAVVAFNVARARQQASMVGGHGAAVGGGGQPKAQAQAGVYAAPTAARPPAPAPAPGAFGSPTAPASTARKHSLRRAASMRRGFVGALGEAAGIPAVAWIEGKPQAVTLRADAAMKDLNLFPRPDAHGKLPKGLDASSPMAIVPGGAYAAVRIGKPIRDGKNVHRGGTLLRLGAPKSDKVRTVCLDNSGNNTLVELECASAGEAEALKAALEGLSQSAAAHVEAAAVEEE